MGCVQNFQENVCRYSMSSSLILVFTVCKILIPDDLLCFLEGTCRPEKLLGSLSELKKLDAEELFMFSRDILDAIFNIYKHDPKSNIFNSTVFNCLVSKRNIEHNYYYLLYRL